MACHTHQRTCTRVQIHYPTREPDRGGTESSDSVRAEARYISACASISGLELGRRSRRSGLFNGIISNRPRLTCSSNASARCTRVAHACTSARSRSPHPLVSTSSGFHVHTPPQPTPEPRCSVSRPVVSVAARRVVCAGASIEGWCKLMLSCVWVLLCL
jgi:hypothetical protein